MHLLTAITGNVIKYNKIPSDVIYVTDQYAVTLTLYLVGKFSIAVVMTSVYVYTAELFPTPHRHSLFAYCSMVGRLGSILAPLTPALVSAHCLLFYNWFYREPDMGELSAAFEGF